jgi:hypothetical protein
VQEPGIGQRSDITVYRSWELDRGQILQCTGAENWTKVRYYSVQELGTGQGQILQFSQELGTGQRSDITIFTGAGNWTKVRYYSVQELRTGQRSDITVYRSWELDRGQILQCRSQELDRGQILQCTGDGNWTEVRYYSVQELRTGQRSDITVYRSWELHKVRYYNFHRSWELDKGQILQCTGAGNWTEVRYYSVQELRTGQRSDITVQELRTGQWSNITVYRSWELDKVRYYSVQELGTGQGQILQCTGAGNWTEVRYYSAGARNWTKVRYYSAGAENWTRSDITVYRS